MIRQIVKTYAFGVFLFVPFLLHVSKKTVRKHTHYFSSVAAMQNQIQPITKTHWINSWRWIGTNRFLCGG